MINEFVSWQREFTAPFTLFTCPLNYYFNQLHIIYMIEFILTTSPAFYNEIACYN